MRWIGSLVAESLRILVRGGVFLYPADARPGYHEGQAAAAVRSASHGAGHGVGRGRGDDRRRRILELGGQDAASAGTADHGLSATRRDVAAIHEGIEPMFDSSDAPLFARRGLFR